MLKEAEEKKQNDFSNGLRFTVDDAEKYVEPRSLRNTEEAIGASGGINEPESQVEKGEYNIGFNY